MNGASRRTALVAHGGGGTAVLNASLAGVIEESRRHTEITNLYGARYGLAGILREDFIDLFRQSDETVSRIARSPASALGTSRHDATPDDLIRTLEILRRHDVRYSFYAGGNGSMGTASQLDLLARESGQELHVVGIPKTIDNDLMETDHCPGYGSAARFFACAVRDIGADNRALPGQVEFVEVLGRNVGWIVAATAFARRREDDAPHLIYFPEAPLPLKQLLNDVHRVYQRLGRCVVAVCEGQLDERGQPFGADVRASSRGSLAMNLAHRLALLVSERLKIRARSEKPGLLGRSSAVKRVAVRLAGGGLMWPRSRCSGCSRTRGNHGYSDPHTRSRIRCQYRVSAARSRCASRAEIPGGMAQGRAARIATDLSEICRPTRGRNTSSHRLFGGKMIHCHKSAQHAGRCCSISP